MSTGAYKAGNPVSIQTEFISNTCIISIRKTLQKRQNQRIRNWNKKLSTGRRQAKTCCFPTEFISNTYIILTKDLCLDAVFSRNFKNIGFARDVSRFIEHRPK